MDGSRIFGGGHIQNISNPDSCAALDFKILQISKVSNSKKKKLIGAS